MSIFDHQWEQIFRRQGHVYPEPFPLFFDVLERFRRHGCRTVLDLGCGTGRHVVHLARAGFSVTGMDVSQTGLLLTAAWQMKEGQRARLLQADMRRPLPFCPDCFDGVFSTQVIHHALRHQMLETIDEIWRLMRPGGLTFITVAGGLDEGIAFVEVEPDTFVPQSGDEAGLPHYISSEASLTAAFGRFHIVEMHRRAEGKVLTVLARKPQ